MSTITDKTLLENFLNLIPAGVFWKDKDRRFLGANQMFLDYYGLGSVSELIGNTDEDMGWHIDPEPFKSDELRVISNGDSIKNVLGQCIVQGKIRKIRASKSPLYDNGEITGLVGYFMDITDEVEERQRLSYLSQTDDLTGVFNRRAYNDVVLQYEEQYKTNKTDFVLYMIDLDDFKKINDEFGHEYGNMAIIAVSKALSMAAAENCVLFRYGGDEFVVLHQLQSADEIEVIEKRLLKAIDSPRKIDDAKIVTKASIGHAIYSETNSLLSLIELADKRMYEMKKEHKAKR